MRSRSHTTGSNGLSRARASTLRGSSASRCSQAGRFQPSIVTGSSSPSSTSSSIARWRRLLALAALQLEAVVVGQATDRGHPVAAGSSTDQLLGRLERVGTGAARTAGGSTRSGRS